MANLGQIYLLQNTVKESDVIENFRRIQNFFHDSPFLNCGFVFRTFEIPAGLLTNFAFKHNLRFIPKDIVVSAISNNATVTWHYDNFDRDFVYLTVSAPCKIRAFLGTYKDDTE